MADARSGQFVSIDASDRILGCERFELVGCFFC